MKNLMLFMVLFFACNSCQAAAQVPANWPARVQYWPGDRYGLPGHKTEIRYIDPVVGSGLFAQESIPAGALIAEYTGQKKVVHHSLLPRLNYAATLGAFDPNTNTFEYLLEDVFSYTNQVITDAEFAGNETRFCNHSDRSNAKFTKDDRVPKQIFVTTVRSIAPGEEITVDYGSGYWMSRRITPQPR